MEFEKIILCNKLDELKEMGKMLEIKREIQNNLGTRIKIKSRSWDELFLAIQKLSSLMNKSTDSENSLNKVDSLTTIDENIEYFKTKTDEIIYSLIELTGKQRQKKLDITEFCYKNPQYAKKWRNEIIKYIHPDKNNHPKANQAMAVLQELYEGMIKE